MPKKHDCSDVSWLAPLPELPGESIEAWASYLAPWWVLEHFWIISEGRFVILCSWDFHKKNLGRGDTILEAMQMALCKQEGLHPEEKIND